MVRLHAVAPAKPAFGASCNGCGVCCAAEPCPVARFLLGVRTGDCLALAWDEAARRYFCGMARHPAGHLRWLPEMLNNAAARACRRWISAGSGCDCDAEVAPE
ncbi:MAG: hypothetical protein Q8O34_10105 [Rhodocyclaceae bacterium]|nr:hypothetical protein [Rhodocyclaceae bacterium]